MIQLSCVFICACAVAIISAMRFRPTLFTNSKFSFWGSEQWVRKYDYGVQGGTAFFFSAPNNWYYNLFKITYKERFPLSATILVFLTDAFHFFQFIAIKAGTIALSLSTSNFWLWFVVISAVWHLGFNLTFTIVRKK